MAFRCRLVTRKTQDRVLRLWVVYLDKRCKKSWSHSIGQSIKYQSTLDTLQHIDSCVEDSVENFNLPQVHIDDDEDNETQMWEYIRLNITPQEEELLDMLLDVDQPKLKGNLKKEYQALLPKLKEIITEFKKSNND